MAHVNMNASVSGSTTPGTYLAKVKSAIEKQAVTSGAMMFALELEDAATGQLLCKDNIMIEGNGFGIGRAKLIALGIPPNFNGDIPPHDFVGKMIYVALIPRDYTDKNGVTRQGLTVNINDGLSGYWSTSNPPADLAARQAKIIAADSEPAF